LVFDYWLFTIVMPNFDGTGPRGEGAKTGLKQGNCDEKDSNIDTRRGLGLGRGCRKGCGRGRMGMGRGNAQNQ
jgi:hypothetical protein